MFGFLTTREDVILSRFISSHDRVLVVGPSEDIRLDPTLLVLIRKIKNRNLFVIDKEGIPTRGKIWENYENPGFGDVDLFRESIKKWVRTDPTQYFLGDAQKMPFGSGTFDVIVDRVTHLFILGNNAQRLLFQGHYKPHDADFYAAETLIWEYDRVLKKDGQIIFLASNASERFKDGIINALKNRKYYVIEGNAKSSRTLKIGFRLYVFHKFRHKVAFYIVGIKK